MNRAIRSTADGIESVFRGKLQYIIEEYITTVVHAGKKKGNESQACPIRNGTRHERWPRSAKDKVVNTSLSKNG